MKMKNILLIAAVGIMMFFTSDACAQNKGKKEGNGGWHDRMKAEKIAYLTSAMDLTSSEAEKFWPIYNEAEAEKMKGFKATFTSFDNLKKAIDGGKGEKEIVKLLNEYVDAQMIGNEVDAKYIEKYCEVLPAEKVAKLFLAEEGFRKQQINKLGKHDQRPDDDGPTGKSGNKPSPQN